MLVEGVQRLSMKEGKLPNEIRDAITCGSQNCYLYSVYDNNISLTNSPVREIFLNWYIGTQGHCISMCITITEW